MLDPKLLRTQLEQVAARLKKRGFQLEQGFFSEIEDQRKRLQVETQELQSIRNQRSREIGAAKGRGEDIQPLKAQMDTLAGALKEKQQQLQSLQSTLRGRLMEIPNIPDESVPEGNSEQDNKVERVWGEPTPLVFEPGDHAGLGAALQQLDFEAAAKITGTRFVVMYGQLARLQRALIQFMLDMHTRAHGYTEVYAPFIVNSDSLRGTGQLPKFKQDLFQLDTDSEYYLIPTAEVPVTNLWRNQIADLEQLPLKYVCHTPCFRSEAGSYGKDTRGLIRQHQFEKVELVQLVHPDHSWPALQELTGHAEAVCRHWSCLIVWSRCVEGIWVLRRQKLMIWRFGCRRRAAIGKFPRAVIFWIFRRGACRRAGRIRTANRSYCIPLMARGWLWDEPWWRFWRTVKMLMAA